MNCKRSYHEVKEFAFFDQGTRFNYILNLEGFNVFQHGCPPCMITYVRILRSYRRYWPEMIDRLIFINGKSFR